MHFSVVIDNFYIVGVSIVPNKAQPKLIVDANAVLSCPVSRERFQPVSRRDAQFVQFDCCVQNS